MNEHFDERDAHSRHSTLRERIVEHVFVGDALRRLWQLGVADVEVLRSGFDAGGYDLVMGYREIVRHIQFKTVKVGGKAADTKISVKLMDKPSGCVICIVVTPQLDLQSCLWFGGAPGQPLPDIRDLRVARHTKGNAEGSRTHRPNQRIVPRSHFEPLATMDDVLVRLFGPFQPSRMTDGEELAVEDDAPPYTDFP